MPTEAVGQRYLERIAQALKAASDVAKHYAGGTYHVRDNGGRDVVTQVDREVSDVLRQHLLRAGEGWLSEEDRDDKARLGCDVVWTVDPLDGTREFVDGVPEYCISVGLVAEGVAVAGGVCNPDTGELFLGTPDGGMTYNGAPTRVSNRTGLDGAVVLASRQEYQRGEWKRFAQDRFTVRPMGSVAYKLALVAAGLADATWTLSPKHEWDVAAGVALVTSAGGVVGCPGSTGLRLNRPLTLLPGLMASGKNLWPEIAQLITRRTDRY